MPLFCRKRYHRPYIFARGITLEVLNDGYASYRNGDRQGGKNCQATKAHKRLPDPGKAGLYLSIGKTETTRWEARVRVAAENGAPRSIGVGCYPDARVAIAPDSYDAVRVSARAGNPLATLRCMYETARAPSTPPDPPPASPTPIGPAPDSLATELKIYEAEGSPGTSWPEGRKRIELVFKAQLAMPVASPTAVALQQAADQYPSRASAAFVVRTLRPALHWLAKRRHCPTELAAIEPPVRARKQERRRLSRAELARVLQTLGAGLVMHGRCLRFILHTACRRAEALAARWRDIDWREGLWTISQNKSGIQHVIPLPWQVIALLHHHYRPAEEDPDALIFCSDSGHQLGNWDRTTEWFHDRDELAPA